MPSNEDQDILDQIAELRRKQASELQAMQADNNPLGLALSGSLGGLADIRAAGAGLGGGYTEKAVNAYESGTKGQRDLRLKALEGTGEEIKALGDLARSRASERRFTKMEEGKDKRAQAQRANEIAVAEAKAAAKEGAEKQLPASQVLSVNEGSNTLNMLRDVGGTLEKNSDLFGPIYGRAAALIPYGPDASRARTIEAQLKTAAQKVGTFLEGGKLTDSDIKKYESMLPNNSDSPEVAKNKLALVERMVAAKQASDIQALKGSQYNIAGLQGIGANVPELPTTLAGRKVTSGGLINEAQAAGAGTPDPVIDAYSKQHGLDYRKAEAILRARGYGK